METGFLNFHDEEHFSDFSYPLNQYDLLDVTPNSLCPSNDLEYIQSSSSTANTTDELWETEQELNGDMAVLPVSGVASVVPKIESIKEDFVKVLTDWQEHIGYLQASDTEEDINVVALNMNNTPEKLNTIKDITDGNSDKDLPLSSEKYQLTHVNTTNNTVIKKLQIDNEIDQRMSTDSISEQTPVLEAGDVKSLLEQFEASEASLDASINTHSISINPPQKITIDKCKKDASKLHKNIRDLLPKEVIDRIRASGRKKAISVIPALSINKNDNRHNGTRMQEAAATLSRNKLLKIVTNATSSNGRADASVQLDHDYCSSSNLVSSNCSGGHGKPSGKHGIRRHVVTKPNVTYHGKSTLRKDIMKCNNNWGDSNSKKDSGLESGEVSDASEDPTLMNTSDVSNTSKHSILSTCSKLGEKENKIRSVLATSILQFRNGVITKTKSIDAAGPHMGKPMISVLKKSPINSLLQSSNSNITESVVTTKNSSNNEVQNIIIQDKIPMSTCENETKAPRKKLNLAEYRSRREQARSDNSRTSSPIQPMTLVYIHHVSTTTEPIKDDPENPIWSEREIVSVLKPKSEVEALNNRSKPVMNCVSVQTYETVFSQPMTINTDEGPEIRMNRIKRKGTNYRQRTTSSSSSGSRSGSRGRKTQCNQRSGSTSYKKNRRKASRSRSRSLSRSKSRSRSRSKRVSRNRSSSRSSRSNSRGRSRSCSLSRRRNIRQRKISHRRSSVSSSSSWSSRSRSRSTYRSRSRSRSSRSRSGSRSSRYSSYSRSSNKSKHHGQVRCSRRRGYNYGRYSSENNDYNRHWRRSPSYKSACNPWHNHEKRRQVEERRVIYVGGLDADITKNDLKRRFQVFGPVLDISLHFREHSDNYGFVTFEYRADAYEAVEHGNDDPSLPRYDLCFGGRREFCKVKYADLDGAASDSYESGRSLINSNKEDNSFDLLLKEAKAKLRNKKA